MYSSAFLMRKGLWGRTTNQISHTRCPFLLSSLFCFFFFFFFFFFGTIMSEKQEDTPLGLYESAAQILETARKGRGSVKALVQSSQYKHKKKLFAVLCQTLKCKHHQPQCLASETTRRKPNTLLLIPFLLLLETAGIALSRSTCPRRHFEKHKFAGP